MFDGLAGFVCHHNNITSGDAAAPERVAGNLHAVIRQQGEKALRHANGTPCAWLDDLPADASLRLAQRLLLQLRKGGVEIVGVAAAHDAVNLLRDKGYLVSGDIVIVTQGDVMSTIGSTNTTRVMTVE